MAGTHNKAMARRRPSSWTPDSVEVIASRDLALSSGPVRNAQGCVIARLNSVWRLAGDGQWRVVFDMGSPPESQG